MASLLQMIKQAAKDAVDASNPVSLLPGEVVSVDPLSVQVDQRFVLTAEFLVVPERLVHYEVDLSHDHQGATEKGLTEPLVIRRGLVVGDRVLLLRVQGGQQYVILDRVVNA